jgi:2-polyprenyl-3-methyl-5-hydroxy-6-metoxy-1,4-benzoquinol methylase
LNESQNYPLGYSEQETRRLADQGALLEDLTKDVLQRAGVAHGMRVLDIGCGVGDVSLLAARIVGTGGSVLGVDRASSSVETARRRAASLGVTNLHFAEADAATLETDQRFDAIVGRLVLLYLPHPATVLRDLLRYLRPGGIVAFQEYDMSTASQAPPSELFMKTRRWILDAFTASGAHPDMGTKLFSTFLDAGLPPPSMMASTPVVAGPTTAAGYEHIVQILRSLLPLIERRGLAYVSEIDIDTLAARLRDDAVAHARVAFRARVVGAWARLPEAGAGMD